MTGRAHPESISPSPARIATCEANFHVTALRGPLSSPEMLLAAVKREILPALSQVLERAEWQNVDLDIAKVEIDLGDWPGDPIWSEVRHLLALKLQLALEAHVRPHDLDPLPTFGDRSPTTLPAPANANSLGNNNAPSERAQNTVGAGKQGSSENNIHADQTKQSVSTSQHPPLNNLNSSRIGSPARSREQTSKQAHIAFAKQSLSPTEAAQRLSERAIAQELDAFAAWLAQAATIRPTQEILSHLAGNVALQASLLIWQRADEVAQKKILRVTSAQMSEVTTVVTRLAVLAESVRTKPQAPTLVEAQRKPLSDQVGIGAAQQQASFTDPASTTDNTLHGSAQSENSAASMVETLSWLISEPSCSSSDRYVLSKLRQVLLEGSRGNTHFDAAIAHLKHTLSRTGAEESHAGAHALRLVARLRSEEQFETAFLIGADQVAAFDREVAAAQSQTSASLEPSTKVPVQQGDQTQGDQNDEARSTLKKPVERASIKDLAYRLSRDAAVLPTETNTTRDALSDIITKQPVESFAVALGSGHITTFASLLDKTVALQAVLFGPAALTPSQLRTLYAQVPDVVSAGLHNGNINQMQRLAQRLIPKQAKLIQSQVEKLRDEATDPLSALRQVVLALLQNQSVDFEPLRTQTMLDESQLRRSKTSRETPDRIGLRNEPPLRSTRSSPNGAPDTANSSEEETPSSSFAGSTDASERSSDSATSDLAGTSSDDAQLAREQTSRSSKADGSTANPRRLSDASPATSAQSLPNSNEPPQVESASTKDMNSNSAESPPDNAKRPNVAREASKSTEASEVNAPTSERKHAEPEETRPNSAQTANAEAQTFDKAKFIETGTPLTALLAISGLNAAEIDRVMNHLAAQQSPSWNDSATGQDDVRSGSGVTPGRPSKPSDKSHQSPNSDPEASHPATEQTDERKQKETETPGWAALQSQQESIKASNDHSRQTPPFPRRPDPQTPTDSEAIRVRSDADLQDHLAALATTIAPSPEPETEDALQLFWDLWPNASRDGGSNELSPSNSFPTLLARIAAHTAPELHSLSDQIAVALPVLETDPQKQAYGLRAVAARLSSLSASRAPGVREELGQAIDTLLYPASEQTQEQSRNEEITQTLTSPYAAENIGEQTLQVTETAGLVLFHPFYPMLFDRLKIEREGKALRSEHIPLARGALNFLSGTTEQNDPLQRVLLGLDAAVPLPEAEAPDSDAEVLMDGLLRSVVERWGRLGATSPDGLRETFVRRTGTLRFDATAAHLRVTSGAFDMLLDSLPWSLGPVALPWMPLPCVVSWREEADN